MEALELPVDSELPGPEDGPTSPVRPPPFNEPDDGTINGELICKEYQITGW